MPIPTRLPADVELRDALSALHDPEGTPGSPRNARADGSWPQVTSRVEKEYTDNLSYSQLEIIGIPIVAQQVFRTKGGIADDHA